MNFRSEESEIPEDEPFVLEGLSRYQLNQQLLNTLIEQQDASAMYRRFRAAGELPYGAFGELAWEAQRQEMQNRLSGLSPVVNPRKVWRLTYSATVSISPAGYSRYSRMGYCAGVRRC